MMIPLGWAIDSELVALIATGRHPRYYQFIKGQAACRGSYWPDILAVMTLAHPSASSPPSSWAGLTLRLSASLWGMNECCSQCQDVEAFPADRRAQSCPEQWCLSSLYMYFPHTTYSIFSHFQSQCLWMSPSPCCTAVVQLFLPFSFSGVFVFFKHICEI